MMPPATKAPPDMTPRGPLRGDGITAISHRSIPKTTRAIPKILRGRAVFSNLTAARRRLCILHALDKQSLIRQTVYLTSG
jgi:hypothetical protein